MADPRDSLARSLVAKVTLGRKAVMWGCGTPTSHMPDEAANRTAKDADRRLFLEKAGRFAAVTPPVVALMLAASSKDRAAAASGGTTLTTKTTTTSSSAAAG